MSTPTGALALALVTLSPSFAAGLPPANDNFADAADLGTSNSVAAAGTNVEATEELGEPNPAANPGFEALATVWWKFQVPADGFVEVSTEGSAFDTVLGVFTGADLFDLEEEASDDDGGAGTTSKLTFAALAGTEYFVQVSGSAGAEGAIALSLSPGTAPTPPSLTSITLLPSPIDVTSDDGSVTATLVVESPDGFDYGQIAVFDPAGQDTGSGGQFGEAQRVAGDAFSGTYEVELFVSTYSPPGTYSVDLALAETNGDNASYGAGALPWPGGATGTFEVINAGAADASPPQVTSFSRSPDSVDVSSSAANVAVSVGATDDLGLQFLLVDVYDPDDFYLFSAVGSLSSGTITAGTWTANVPVAPGTPPGSYRLEARAVDFSGKSDSYDPIADEDQLTVTNSAGVDVDPPALTSLSFSPNPVIRGNPVTVTIDFSDDLAGLAQMSSNLRLHFYDAGGALQFSDPFSLADLIDGNAMSGTLQYPTNISASAPTGVWQTEIDLQDGAGNLATHGNLGAGGNSIPFPPGTGGELSVVDAGGTAYAIWIARYPSLSGDDALPLADPDGDGWVNLLELPFDGDPTLPISSDPKAANFPTAIFSPTEIKLQFRLVTVNMQGTEGLPISLVGWVSGDLQSGAGIPVTDLGGGLFEVIAPADVEPRGFLQLRVDDPN